MGLYKAIKLKVTNKTIGEFFGLSSVTVSSYKNSDDESVRNRYYAMRDYFKKVHGLR